MEHSLTEFNRVITDTTVSVMDLKDGMEWPHKDNLAISPYPPLKNPLFVIDLILDHDGIRYSTNLESFETMIVSVFDRGIFVTQSIPQLEKVGKDSRLYHQIFTIFSFFADHLLIPSPQMVLEKLFWAGTPLLESVGAHEPQVESLRLNIVKCIRQSLIPLKAYLKQYDLFLPLAKLSIPDYLKYVLRYQHWYSKLDPRLYCHLFQTLY